MWSLTGILVLSVVALATGDMPLNKQFTELDEAMNIPIGPFADETKFRLPNNTIPINYNILLKTDIHAGIFEFFGAVEILFEVVEAGNEITLQHRQMAITKVDLFDAQGTEIIEEGVLFDSNSDYTEFLIIKPIANLVFGTRYTLKIEYEGTIRDDMGGFYRSSYINADKKQVWLAATQFESTNARHAFPSYDEPGIRAKYTISIRHHRSYIAVSNMLESTPQLEPGTEYVVTKFAQTPITFQSYLVAFVVCDFKMIEDNSAIPKQRVFATAAQIDNKDADFALDFGVRSLKALEDYLGVKYLMPKLDQILVPDFAAGAMENYGLVTYREANLLYNPKVNSVDRQIRVAEVIAHEYAHQWFGNHVSPAWWDYIWLNEGFAALFQNYATHLVFSDWREMEIFVVGVVQYVFQSDSLNPLPMTVWRDTEALLASTGGDVTYSKSGSVLRMLQMVMTEATFAKGLKLYLEKMVEKSANSEDLWESMQSGFLLDNVGSTLSLPAIMRTWELQPGFPVVNVAINNNILTLTQERYHQNSKTDATGQIWSIPLSYATASNPSFTVTTPDVWLYEKTMTLESKTPKTWAANDWIIFNLQETGYYRVNYDLQLWKLLTDELTKGDITKFHTTNRAQLLDDSFNLARTDRLTYNVPLEIVTYLKKESDYIPWASFNRAMSFLQPYMMGSPQYHHFKQLILDNVDAFYTRLGATPKTNEKLMDRLGRNMAIGWACSMEHPKCLSDTKEQMEKVVAGTLIEPDLQSAMYCNGMRVASKATFDAIWASALVPDNEVLKSVILSGLGCSTDATLLKAFLDSSLMSTFAYTPEDKLQVLTSVYSNGGIEGFDMVITFMQETSLANIKSNFANQILNILSNLANRMSSTTQMNKIKALLTKFTTELSAENTAAINKVLTDRTAWSEKNVRAIETWLMEYFEQIEPPVTDLPQSTIAIETTTNGSSAIFIPIVALFMGIFLQIVNIMN